MWEILPRPRGPQDAFAAQQLEREGVYMSHGRGTGHRGLTAIAVAVLLLGGVASAHPLTTPDCLAKKLRAWGNLRRCQAIENGEALQGKESNLPACQTTFNDELAKVDAMATAASTPCRYGVNGDGTATDYDTGLQWEQKTSDGSVHDTGNLYTWSDGGGGFTQPDGTAFKVFLGTLNNRTNDDGTETSRCFAGHCDWRLPAIGELAGIVDLSAPGCSTFTGRPCIDQTVFGPTVADNYWSAATDAVGAHEEAPGPSFAWAVDFNDGGVGFGDKGNDGSVRGVRSAL